MNEIDDLREMIKELTRNAELIEEESKKPIIREFTMRKDPSVVSSINYS